MKKIKKISILSTLGSTALLATTAVVVASCSSNGEKSNPDIVKSIVSLKNPQDENIKILAGSKEKVTVDFICTFLDKDNKEVKDKANWSFWMKDPVNKVKTSSRQINDSKVIFNFADGVLSINAESCPTNFNQTYLITVYANTFDNSLKDSNLGYKTITVTIESAIQIDHSIVSATSESLTVKAMSTSAVADSTLSCKFYDTEGEEISGQKVKWVIDETLPIQQDGTIISFDESTNKLKVDASNSTNTQQQTFAITFVGQNQNDSVPNPGSKTINITVDKADPIPYKSYITNEPATSLEVTAGSTTKTQFTFTGTFEDQFGQSITTDPKWSISSDAPSGVTVNIDSSSGELTITAENNHDVSQSTFNVVVKLQDANGKIKTENIGTKTITVTLKPDVVAIKSSVNSSGQSSVTAGASGEEGKKSFIFTPEFKNAGDKTIPGITPNWIIEGIPDETEQTETKITFTKSEENNQLIISVDATKSHVNAQKTYTLTIKAQTQTSSLAPSEMTEATYTVTVNPDTVVKYAIATINDKSDVNLISGNTSGSGKVQRTCASKFYNAGYQPTMTPEEKAAYEITVPAEQQVWSKETSGGSTGYVEISVDGGTLTIDASNTDEATELNFKASVKVTLKDATSPITQTSDTVIVNVQPNVARSATTGDNSITLDAGTSTTTTNPYVCTFENENQDTVNPQPQVDWKIDADPSWPAQLSGQVVLDENNRLRVDTSGYSVQSTETYTFYVYGQPVGFSEITGNNLRKQAVTITITKPAVVIDSSTVSGGDDSVVVDAQATKTATNAYTASFYDATPTEIPGVEPEYSISAPNKPDTVNLSINSENKLVVDASSYVTESQSTFTVSVTANPKNGTPLTPDKQTAKVTNVTVNAYTPVLLPNKSVTVGPNSFDVTIGANNTSAAYLCNFYIDDTLYTDSVPTIWHVDPVGDLPTGVNVKMIGDKLNVEAKQYSGEATSFDVNVYASTTPAASQFTYEKQTVTVNLVAKSDQMKYSTVTGPENVMVQVGTVHTVEEPYNYEFTDASKAVVAGIPDWIYAYASGYGLPDGVTAKMNDDNQLVIDASSLTSVPSNATSKLDLTVNDLTATLTSKTKQRVNIQFVPNTTTNLMTYNNTVYHLADNINPAILCAGPDETLEIQTTTETLSITPENKSKITYVSIPSIDPNTTTIPPYFMYGFGVTSIDLSGVPATATVQHNFLQECTNLTNINMGSITRDNMLDDVGGTNYNDTFFTVNDSSAKAYTTGLTIRGDDSENIIADFPSRLVGISEAPYRRIQEYKNYLVQSDGSIIGLVDELDSTAFTAGSGFCTSGSSFTLKKYGESSTSSIAKKGITEIVISNVDSNVTSLGQQFLMDCTDLIRVDLHGLKNIESIGGSFMNGCTSLTSVDLTGLGAVTSAGTNFLKGCTGLTYVDFSPMSSLQTIGTSFLANCSSIKYVNLSNCMNLTSISGTNGFLDQCNSLTTLYLPDKTPIATIVANGWGVVNSLQYICCGSQATADLYAADTNWKAVNDSKKSKFTVQFII